jgi:hypothetical protein
MGSSSKPGRANFPNYVYNSAAGESAYTKPFFSILSLLFQLSREPWHTGPTLTDKVYSFSHR